jgi:hypothetical protein
MPDGLTADFGSVEKGAIVTIEVGNFKTAGDLADRAMPARNSGLAHDYLVGGISSQQQRAILYSPNCSLQ